MSKNLIAIMFIACIAANANAQLAASTENPLDAKIIYKDVVNFINAFNMLDEQSDTVQVLQTHYIDKGTPGLKIFIEKYALTAESLKKALQKNPEDYLALPDKLEWIKSQEDSVRMYFVKLKHFIPKAIYPPTYFLVGRRLGIGSGSIEGQLITIEKKAVDIKDMGLKTHIIHELVHLNQLQSIGSLEKYLAIYNDEKSLLSITIREGVAEFFAKLVTGEYTQNQAEEYVLKNERLLWDRFEKEMLGKDTKDWMWEKPENPDQPRDIAYVLGALIIEYYYTHAPDLDSVVDEVLSITNYEKFLQKTQYIQKFKN